MTLDRPEARNGCTRHMADEIAAALLLADNDPGLRVVVLTGAGEDFCVGADLAAGKGQDKEFTTTVDDETAAQVRGGTYQEPAGVVTRVPYAMNKPVIAAVRGAAVGVEATMLLPADFRLAGTDTGFSFPFSRRGIVPEGASTWFLPRLGRHTSHRARVGAPHFSVR
ncbi:enoyl-CoA hydratase-related protein [Streptomyces sp. NPDC058545]|uniref:enoyl-CoA hydratase-related protein n=1 Tax=Streptomyces sp. NPDC058545 TaxID=3346544 RepID=UPI00364CDFA9